MKRVPRITAWSASRIFDYELCPAKVAFAATHPRPEPEPGSPLAEGLRIHKQGEAYLKGEVREVPPTYRYFARELRALRKAGAQAEAQWAFTEKWDPCEWFARETWCRMVVDAVVENKTTLRVVDFKTGRPHPDRDEAQLELYAVGAFARLPHLRTVTLELWYLKRGEDVKITVRRSDVVALRVSWQKRAQALLEAVEFPAQPGPPGKWPCGYCDWSKVKGGPCAAG